jgi:RNA polymerase sigma factor (sigma-70 family)
MHLRRSRRMAAPVAELDGIYELHDHPDLGASYRAALDACLATLDRRSREVLRLRYTEARSRAAIAAALDLAPEGVKTLLRRTKARLRECIEKRRQT